MKHIGQHAIVIGASMGGLLAARALSDFYAVVTVLERDAFPQSDIARKGVPQGRHANGLLARDRIALGGQSSLKLFDQRLPTLYILAHPQHDTERCQVVRQLAIGTGIHTIDERGDRIFEVTSVKIIECALLTPFDILVARNIRNNRTIHSSAPNRIRTSDWQPIKVKWN
jgi:hypothetical protein